MLKPLQLLVLMLGLLPLSSGFAATPVDIFEFSSGEQEARYRALIDEFRCPKCLNTNISGSDAPIAQDLRRTVYRLLVEDGMTDQQIRDFLVARYGDFVLYDPPFRPDTWVLWLGPLVFLLLGLAALLRIVHRSTQTVALSAEDQQRIADILERRDSL
jgi:cytochrome c-type biogenesis protein CcmH